MKIIRGSGYSDLRRASNSITYAAGGTGAAGTTTNIFTVTGEVLVGLLVPFCTTSLTESAGTPELSLGVTGGLADFVASTVATIIDINEFWLADPPVGNSGPVPAALKEIAITDHITCTVGGTNNISAGVIRYDLYWRPLSSNGLVVPA